MITSILIDYKQIHFIMDQRKNVFEMHLERTKIDQILK